MKVKYAANFISPGSKIFKSLRRRQYDQVIIERAKGIVLRHFTTCIDVSESVHSDSQGGVDYRATSSGTKARTIIIVTLVPAEHGGYRLKLRHLNFDP